MTNADELRAAIDWVATSFIRDPARIRVTHEAAPGKLRIELYRWLAEGATVETLDHEILVHPDDWPSMIRPLKTSPVSCWSVISLYGVPVIYDEGIVRPDPHPVGVGHIWEIGNSFCIFCGRRHV